MARCLIYDLITLNETYLDEKCLELKDEKILLETGQIYDLTKKTISQTLPKAWNCADRIETRDLNFEYDKRIIFLDSGVLSWNLNNSNSLLSVSVPIEICYYDFKEGWNIGHNSCTGRMFQKYASQFQTPNASVGIACSAQQWNCVCTMTSGAHSKVFTFNRFYSSKPEILDLAKTAHTEILQDKEAYQKSQTVAEINKTSFSVSSQANSSWSKNKSIAEINKTVTSTSRFNPVLHAAKVIFALTTVSTLIFLVVSSLIFLATSGLLFMLGRANAELTKVDKVKLNLEIVRYWHKNVIPLLMWAFAFQALVAMLFLFVDELYIRRTLKELPVVIFTALVFRFMHYSIGSQKKEEIEKQEKLLQKLRKLPEVRRYVLKTGLGNSIRIWRLTLADIRRLLSLRNSLETHNIRLPAPELKQLLEKEKDLLKKEMGTQEYTEFKKTILSKNPIKFKDYMKVFVANFGEGTSKQVEYLNILLSENGRIEPKHVQLAIKKEQQNQVEEEKKRREARIKYEERKQREAEARKRHEAERKQEEEERKQREEWELIKKKRAEQRKQEEEKKRQEEERRRREEEALEKERQEIKKQEERKRREEEERKRREQEEMWSWLKTIPDFTEYVRQIGVGTPAEIEDIQHLLKSDYDLDLSIEQLKPFLEREREEQAYNEFKKIILEKKPINFNEHIDIFVQRFGRGTNEHREYLSKLLEENGKQVSAQNIETAITDFLKERERKARVERLKQKLSHGKSTSGKDLLRERTHTIIEQIDKMDGHKFEDFLVKLFRTIGYECRRMPKTGDQGADLIISKYGIRTIVQAKRHNTAINNKAIQEAHAAKAHYNCQEAIVVTNNYFNESARALARSTKVELWDRNVLKKYVSDYL